MCRVSSNITPSKIASSASGRIFLSRASAIAPKPTNESVHSPKPKIGTPRRDRRVGDVERRRVDAVALDDVRHEPPVARLLDALQRDRLADQRVVDGLRERGDHPAGALLDRARIAPERKGAQPLRDRRRRGRGHGSSRLERDVRLDEGPAEKIPVLRRSDSHARRYAPLRQALPARRERRGGPVDGRSAVRVAQSGVRAREP